MSEDAAVVMMRDDVIERALERRAPGRPLGAPVPSSPLDAFMAAAEQLAATLRSLDGDDWAAHAHDFYGSVAGLIAHLVGMERLAVEWVEAPADAPLAPSDHVAATRSAMEELAGTDPGEVAELWFEAALRLHRACAASDPEKPVLAHDIPTDVDGLLVLRAFELWTHLQDVCTAVGRPCPPLDAARLALMSSRLMDIAPIAVALRGIAFPSRSARFVLTGLGGGCYDVPLGPAGDGTDHDLTIVVDAVDVCRVAARRLDPAEVDVVVDGDAAIARLVIGALDAFAQD